MTFHCSYCGGVFPFNEETEAWGACKQSPNGYHGVDAVAIDPIGKYITITIVMTPPEQEIATWEGEGGHV